MQGELTATFTDYDLIWLEPDTNNINECKKVCVAALLIIELNLRNA